MSKYGDRNLAIGDVDDGPEGPVRELQEDLLTLGFALVGAVDGWFGRKTQAALREFQIYAKMPKLARVRADAAPEQREGADYVALLGAAEGPGARRSAYVDSLEQIDNERRYAGPVSGVANAETRAALARWLAQDHRCPVIVEAWTLEHGVRKALLATNIWAHDEVRSNRPRMYVRDLSGYYEFPPARSFEQYVVLGDHVEFLDWSGPRTVPPNHSWSPEAELLPETLVGTAELSAAQRSTFKIVRAVAEIECLAHFDCINCYDNAFVSVGPCHWTLAISTGEQVARGELGGYLAYLREVDPDAFAAAIGFFGVDVDARWGCDGAALFDANQRKYRGWLALTGEDEGGGQATALPLTEESGDLFRSWHWAYRFAMAGRTNIGYRRRMWDMVRIRIRDIRATPWGGGEFVDPVTIGEVFASELAQAILLRWHVRFPAHVVSGGEAGRRIRGALARARAGAPELDWARPPASWGDAHEQALLAGLQAEVGQTSQALLSTIVGFERWPAWASGANPRGYTLGDPIDGLSARRGSFVFDDCGL